MVRENKHKIMLQTRLLIRIFVLLTLFISALTATATGTVWHVAITGSDESGTGSFGAPYACIQFAADRALVGDTIEVGPGLYASAGNRDILFSGKALTIISTSGPEATAIDCEGSPAVPRRAISFDSGIDSTFRVIGITFKNGYDSTAGGIVYINSGCSPLFENCSFELGESFNGGAVYFNNNSGGIFRDCRFTDNNSDNLGGAVFIEAGSSSRFEQCNFVSNTSDSYGGTIMVGTGATADFTGCLFADGSATWGGGVLYAADASVTFTGCTFARSAAVWTGDVLASTNTTVNLSDCLLHTNQASAPIVCLGSSTTSIDCTDIFSTQFSGWYGCGSSQYETNGNIALDPLFVDYDGGDYRVQSDSPCGPGNNSCGVLLGSEEVLSPVDNCGDLDGDGAITISDAVYAINFIFAGGAAPQDSHGGDMDCSGDLNISDCVYLVNYIFAGGNAPCAACK